MSFTLIIEDNKQSYFLSVCVFFFLWDNVRMLLPAEDDAAEDDAGQILFCGHR